MKALELDIQGLLDVFYPEFMEVSRWMRFGIIILIYRINTVVFIGMFFENHSLSSSGILIQPADATVPTVLSYMEPSRFTFTEWK